MIIGKEALVGIECLARAQGQVYPDSADIGVVLDNEQLDLLRTAVKTLKGVYSGENYSPAPDYNGVRNIIIPIEELGADVPTSTGVYTCTVIDVLVSKQFQNVAFIKIENTLLGEDEIPFFNKAAA
jgi:hypothetical protein